MGTVAVSLVEHPVVDEALSAMRDRELPAEDFRAQCHRAALVLVAEATRALPCPPADVLLVPVLRAGLGLQPAARLLLPDAGTAAVGIWRDEGTLEPHWYLDELPGRIGGRPAFVMDPMLATGGTVAAACSRLAARGAGPLTVVCLICVEEGLKRLEGHVPSCHVFAAAKDPGLDDRGYIVPGLGDAGDRLFGAKGPGAPAGENG